MEPSFKEDLGRFLDPVRFAIEKLGFQPDPKQTEILYRNPSRCILNCTRQWGKSTITALKAVHHAWHTPGSLTLVVSPCARQSAEFLTKAKEFVHLLGMKPVGDGSNAISIRLPNRSRIVGLPGKEGFIRGFSKVSLMLIDEAARVPDDLYLAVRPMLAVSGGDLWLMSTPNGKSGFFYEAWTSQDPSWTRISVPASQCPRISKENLEADRKVMSPFFFRQEYMCEFHDSDSQFLTTQAVHQAIVPGIQPISLFPGQYHYIPPLPPAPLPPGMEPDRFLDSRFYIGVDLGMTNDFTAIAVIERSTWLTGPVSPIDFSRTTERRYEVRHLERLPLLSGYTAAAERCRDLVRHPDIDSNCRMVLDATGVGQPFKEMLRSRGIYGYVKNVIITGGNTETTNGPDCHVPRLHLLNGLNMQLDQGRIRICDRLELAPILAEELLSLKVRVNKAGRQTIDTWNPSKHDDLVFALALASYQATKEKF
ncbi:MAG: hypothetical protein U0R19_06560 [Bryobacteraceae bacterium]